ncbi:MAG: ThuA domain-containing protein [Verrucomicrobiales bacterium]
MRPPVFPLFVVFGSLLGMLSLWRVGNLPATAQDAQPKISVLILDGQNNHNWKETTPILKTALESCGRFEVTVSTSPPKGAKEEEWNGWNPEFSKFDAVMSNYNGELWPAKVRQEFTDYVKNGGAFVVIHAANNSFPLWPEYNEMIGLGGWGGRNEESGPYVYVKDGKVVRDESPGAGGSHGAQSEFLVELLDAAHPITKGMPMKWKHAKDELYDSLRGPGTNMKILAYAHSEKSKKNEPMMMTLEYGKGRVFHTPMGHAGYSMQCVDFFTVVQRGTEWAVTGKVMLPVPPSFPGESAVAPTPGAVVGR